MENLLCFVVMGFGNKTNPDTLKTVNLDSVYKKAIMPAVEQANFICVRADEIIGSGIIDVNMYALLYKADIVIADVSTLNPNAIYELGARHVLKQKKTIVLNSSKTKPFDINHISTIHYDFPEGDITDVEAARIKSELVRLLSSYHKEVPTDSPVYTYLTSLDEPQDKDGSIEKIKNIIVKNRANTHYHMAEKAIAFRKDRNYLESAKIWNELSEKVPNELFYIQQAALCTYKSEHPSPEEACLSALKIINKIESPFDPETWGIMGAINKNLYLLNKEKKYLEIAMENYAKGWVMNKNYYNGENYATCNHLMTKECAEEDVSFYRNTSIMIFKQIIKMLNTDNIVNGETNIQYKWQYATLSNSYLAIGENEAASIFESKFMACNPEIMEIQTFNKTKTYFDNENL